MKPVRTVFVEPRLPKRIEKLWEVAHNTRWSWDAATSRLFMHLDPALWKASDENPVRMLGLMDPARLEELSQDDSFVHHAKAKYATVTMKNNTPAAITTVQCRFLRTALWHRTQSTCRPCS